MTKSLHLLRFDADGDAHPDLARGAHLCAMVLAGARRLSGARRFGMPLDQLARRAGDLLDDIDETLVALDPARDGPSFAVAAKLHRELEHVQAAIAERRRDADSTSTAEARR